MAARLLLGDWGRWIRDPIDLLRGTYVVGAAVLLGVGQFGGAVRLTLTAALVIAVRVLDLPRPLDLAFVIAMGIQGWGNVFDLYENIYWYDTLVHVVFPMLASPVLYVVLSRLGVLPRIGEIRTEHSYIGLFVVTFALGLAFGGALYEIYEYTADAVIGSNLSEGYSDTEVDLIADTAGSAVGGLLLLLWVDSGWAYDRRLPPEKVPQ